MWSSLSTKHANFFIGQYSWFPYGHHLLLNSQILRSIELSSTRQGISNENSEKQKELKHAQAHKVCAWSNGPHLEGAKVFFLYKVQGTGMPRCMPQQHWCAVWPRKETPYL